MMRANLMGKAVADAPATSAVMRACVICGGVIGALDHAIYAGTGGWAHHDCHKARAPEPRSPISPSAAASVLLADPEAVERMVEGACASSFHPEAPASTVERVRMRAALVGALRAIAGETENG